MHGTDNSPLALDFSAVHSLHTPAHFAEVRHGQLAQYVKNQNGACTSARMLVFWVSLSARSSLKVTGAWGDKLAIGRSWSGRNLLAGINVR